MRKVLHLMGVLDEDDLAWLAEHGVQQEVPADMTLVHQGVPISALYILLEGELTVMLKGVREAAARLLPGEVIGEISFIDADPPSASVVAVQGSLVLAVDADLLRHKLTADISFAARFYHAVATFLASRLRSTTRNLGYGPAQVEAGELSENNMEEISLAMVRFDRFLQLQRQNYTAAKTA